MRCFETTLGGIRMTKRLLSSVLTVCSLGVAQTATPSISLTKLGTFATRTFDRGAAEIVAYDAPSQRFFVVNGDQKTLDILDARNLASPQLFTRVAVSRWGDAATSVAVKNGLVAVSVLADPYTDNGTAAFFTTDGTFLAAVPVGPNPDMITFTPDGTKVLTANEGQPSNDYETDPEGSVSIIDVSGGARNLSAGNVRTVDFRRYVGARLDPSINVYGPDANAAQDFEPEYIAVSPDSSTAYVTLQENNAIAVIDIARASVTRLLPLGFKDHSASGNGLDVSDRDNEVNIRNWPVFGIYQPDGIAAFQSGGDTYLITANEGDTRDYEGYGEESRVADLVLDPGAFSDANALQMPSQLGRLTVTRSLGDTDGDGDVDRLYVPGARSFSIWTTDGALVFDSGDQFERFFAEEYADEFNADASGVLDGRSDNKGPEPESVITATFGGRTYAFIALERTSGIMVYDITTPSRPTFVEFVTGRIKGGNPMQFTGGDHGPEGLLVVPAADSPNGRPLLVVANEVSGTTTIWQINESGTPAGGGTVNVISPDGSKTAQSEVSLEATGFASGATYRWEIAPESEKRPAIVNPDLPTARIQFAGVGRYTVLLTVTGPDGATVTQTVELEYVGNRR
jgi:DNA-binding beta-propeller fold protein YncE